MYTYCILIIVTQSVFNLENGFSYGVADVVAHVSAKNDQFVNEVLVGLSKLNNFPAPLSKSRVNGAALMHDDDRRSTIA